MLICKGRTFQVEAPAHAKDLRHWENFGFPIECHGDPQVGLSRGWMWSHILSWSSVLVELSLRCCETHRDKLRKLLNEQVHLSLGCLSKIVYPAKGCGQGSVCCHHPF